MILPAVWLRNLNRQHESFPSEIFLHHGMQLFSFRELQTPLTPIWGHRQSRVCSALLKIFKYYNKRKVNQNYILIWLLIYRMQKTKPINKSNKHTGKQRKKAVKPVTNEEGDPLIKNLSDFVTSIKIAHSSKPIYTGGRIISAAKNIYSTCNAQINIYNFEQDKVVDTIKHTDQEIVNFCICPHEKYIVTFTQNSLIRVLLLENKKIINTVRASGLFANDIQFSPDGRHLAFAFGNTIHIYTFQTMKRTHTYNPTNSKFAITKIQWHPSPEKLQIYSCDLQRNIALFDYILNKVIALGEAGEGGSQFCLSLNGDILVSVNNLEVKIYDSRNLQLQNKFATQQYMESLLVVQNQVFIGGQQTQLFSFPLANPSKIKTHPGCTDKGISKLMVTGQMNNRRLLVMSTQQNISILKINKNGLEYDGMIVGYNDEIIDIKNSKQVQSPYFIMVTNSNNIKVIDKQTHRLRYLIKGHTNIVLCADFWHPYVVSAGKDNVVKLWKIKDDVNKVQLLANYKGHSADILSLVILPENKIIATVSQDNTIKLWSMCLDVEQKVEIKSAIRTTIAHQKSINAIRVSPKQDLLATCSQDRTIKIWNLNLTNIMTLEGHRRGVWDAAFHPIQQIIISAAGDGMLKCWSLVSGECLWSMGEGAALIRCSWIYYNQVVTGSQSGIVKIWDVRKQTSLSYDKHEGKIWALDVTKNEDNIQIFTGATDSIYHIWVDNTKQMKQNIMHEHELEEQQKLFYDQHMLDKNYCEGAIVAFKANYTKLFYNALQKISCLIDAEQNIDFDAQGKIFIVQDMTDEKRVSDDQFQQMVSKLKNIDFLKLLLNIQTMISTVKLYKMGNRILYSLLKQTTFSDLVSLNKKLHFETGDSAEEINEKKSGLVKWLESMISFQQKHSTRLQKYVLGTHWIEHLYKIDNPFSH